VEVRRVVVIPDEVSLIAEEVAASAKRSIRLHLRRRGATHDDVTIEGVAARWRCPSSRSPNW